MSKEDPNALPKEFEILLLGTGLCESILAAAFSRIGHSVLHLDSNTYYGGLEATHSLNFLLDYAKLHADGLAVTAAADSAVDSELSLSLPSSCGSALTNLTYEYYEISDDERACCMRLLDKERCKASGENMDSPPEIEGATCVEESKCEGDSAELHSSSTEDIHPSQRAEKTEVPAADAVDNTVTCESLETGTQEKGGGDTAQPIITGATQQAEDARVEETESINPVVMSYLHAVNSDETETHKLTYLKKKSNRFILDLSPKLLFARSEMIDLLITSDVARYCEFRSITQILTMKDDASLKVVPCSRSDIFATKSLSMVEKRILMKLLTLCMESEAGPEYQAYAEQPYVDFLKSQKLTPNLVDYVVHAIAMVPKSAKTSQGWKRTRQFIGSLGRYGPTPFLWPLYGGEINQAFCRMSAVFGGVYILQRSVAEIIINKEENKVSHIVCNEGMKIGCKWFISNAAYMGETLIGPQSKFLSRVIVISCGSLSTSSDREEAVLLSIPSIDGGDPVTVIELGAAACVCPRDAADLRVCHLTTKSRSTAQDDLEIYVEKLFDKKESSNKPRLLMACYFNIADYSEGRQLQSEHYDNLYITPGPGVEITPDNSVVQAKKIFSVICPGEEFLPRPPDPEDIIFCDDETMKQATGESFAEEIKGVESESQSADGELTETTESPAISGTNANEPLNTSETSSSETKVTAEVKADKPPETS